MQRSNRSGNPCGLAATLKLSLARLAEGTRLPLLLKSRIARRSLPLSGVHIAMNPGAVGRTPMRVPVFIERAVAKLESKFFGTARMPAIAGQRNAGICASLEVWPRTFRVGRRPALSHAAHLA